MREQSVTIDGYVNAVARDSRPIRDRSGEQFIEQIVPGAFERAISRADEIKILLNHDYSRELGSTKTNLQLFEDNIGLRAIAEITDAEVIEKAKKGELRGWSFGFIERAAKEEDTDSGLKRRFVEDMDLKEVSIIDNRKIPCYASTSIEMRADGNEVLEVRTLETKVISSEQKEKVDYSKYEATIRRLGGKS
ncbi:MULTISPECIES: HK97 family phage prohead protease [Blautia]|uniref:HK97 family phage prohead protease n=1 Tax=Blautia TaxID=572511 RepID=UPI00210EC813|nr:HK97 family phage prohead protease [Blautia sp. aa_0143]MCQ4882747.1 HK97 family phage prohead protease [Blautia sp. DFI.9.10]